MRAITVLVSACGAPGTAALLRALRENGEGRPVRLVGTDMSERAVGRLLCDAFRLVPPGSDPGFADAVLDVCAAEEVDVVLPQSSFDLAGLAGARERFSIPVLVSSAETIRRSNDKAECYALLHEIGVPAPAFRRVRGAEAVAEAARELGYPGRPVCFKPVFGSGSRGFRVLDPKVDRAHQLLHEIGVPAPEFRRASGTEAVAEAARELGYPAKPVCFKPVFGSGSRGFRVLDPEVDRAHQLLHERPGAVAMRLEEAVELLPAAGGPDLLVMELATGGERTIDGIADGRRIVLGHPKTRESMRAGLAMYFVTLEDEALMDIAERIVSALEIEHFFNIQLVGEHVIEVNPRISTIVYQEDLNLPYLGVKRALGEVTDEELAALRSRVRPGRTALRYFDQVEWDAPI